MEAAATGRVVVGVDGSPSSVDALRWAFAHAGATGLAVEAVTTWQYPGQYGYEYYGEEQDWDTIARNTLHATLGEVSRPDSVTVTEEVVQGHPAEVLTEASRGADLIVVGSRGHGGFAGLLLGSVSQYVAAHADCPVVVVRHHDPDDQRD